MLCLTETFAFFLNCLKKIGSLNANNNNDNINRLIIIVVQEEADEELRFIQF
jgi:hypothetical protein